MIPKSGIMVLSDAVATLAKRDKLEMFKVEQKPTKRVLKNHVLFFPVEYILYVFSAAKFKQFIACLATADCSSTNVSMVYIAIALLIHLIQILSITA